MTDDLTGKRADRLVIDDPHADVARGWDLASGPDRTSIALVVSEGSPRLPQIMAALATAGKQDQLVILSQSGGQIIDALEPMHARIAKTLAVPPEMLFESVPAEAMARVQAKIEQQSRLLSARIDEALLSGRGFPSAAEAMRQMAGAAQRFGAALREAGWRWPVQVGEPRLSKRRRRRLRGKAKASAR